MGEAAPGSGYSLVTGLAWTLQHVLGATVSPIFPSPPGAPGMTLFGNRLFAGEIKLGLAHPGWGGALTPKTRGERRGEDR